MCIRDRPVNEWGKQLSNSLYRKFWSPQYLFALVFTGSAWSSLNTSLIWEGEGWSTAKKQQVKAYWQRLDVFKSTGQEGLTKMKAHHHNQGDYERYPMTRKGGVLCPPVIKRGRMTQESTPKQPIPACWEEGRLHHVPWSQFPAMWGTKM